MNYQNLKNTPHNIKCCSNFEIPFCYSFQHVKLKLAINVDHSKRGQCESFLIKSGCSSYSLATPEEKLIEQFNYLIILKLYSVYLYCMSCYMEINE